MSKEAVTHKLLTSEEITAAIQERLAAGTLFARHQDEAVSGAEDVILHRSIYRDYFATYMRHIGQSYGDVLSDEQFGAYFDDFATRFLSRQYDFAAAVRPHEIAKERGWVNPFGWDTDSGEITRPLTKLFRRAATLSIDLQHFHDQAVKGALSLTPYENALALYIEHALKTSPNNPPVYDAIIQTQAQVSELSVRLRQEYEDHQDRAMTADDWDKLSGDMHLLMMRQAAGSRINSFRQGAMVSVGKCPFAFKENGFAKTPVDDATVSQFVQDMQLQPFVDAYSNQPVTGCPAIPSSIKGLGSYVGYVVKEFIGVVRHDFWPVKDAVSPAVSSIAQCPFHQNGPAG